MRLLARSTRGRALVAVAVVAVLTVLVVLVRAGSSGPSTGTARPDSSASPSPRVTVSSLPSAVPKSASPLTASQRSAARTSTGRLRTFLERSAAALARNNGKADLASLAAGPALGEIQNLAAQYDNEKITVSGAPRILGIRTLSVSTASDPQTATLAVCLDNRPVKARDAKGRDLGASRTAAELEVLNLYQLQRLQSGWMVVNHSIPADSSCKQLQP